MKLSKNRLKRIICILMSVCIVVEIIFTAPRVTAVVSEATTEISTEITTIDSIDKQGNPTNLQVLMPNWDQISFSTMPGVLSSGGFESGAVGDNISRRWEAGQTPDQYLKLGDISAALKAELFSLNQIASITQLDLQQVALSAFTLAGEQTLEHLVDIVPELGEQLLENVPPIADLVGDVGEDLRQLPIGELLQQLPDLGELKLKAINLDQYPLSSIPNLDSVALEKFTDWADSFLNKVPGLNQVPLSSFPNPLAAIGNIVARIDMVYSKAEAKRRNTISGSDVEGFNVPCGFNCAYIELDNLENQGRISRSKFEGKQWISGKYQKVNGGSGACGRLNGGKEPTGRLPFGDTFKVVVWDVDETTDTVTTALFFRISCGWLGKSPYIIGPIPWFSYRINAPIFVGATTENTPSTQETSTPQTSSETLNSTMRVTENAARISSAANDVVSGERVAGISVDALAEAIASVESSGNDRAVGPYVCADNSTNCGRALGKYQHMSYDPDVQAIIAAKPGGQEFLEQLRSGKPVTEEQVFEFFPPDDQGRLFETKIAAKIQQTSQEIDPTTGKPFAGQRLIERVAQKHFGGDRSAVDSTASDTFGETLYAYGKKLLEHYLQRSGIAIAQSPTTSAGVKANTTETNQESEGRTPSP